MKSTRVKSVLEVGGETEGRKGGAIEFDGVVYIHHLRFDLDGRIRTRDQITAPTSTLY